MLFLPTHFGIMFSLCEWLNKASNISEQIIGKTVPSEAHNKLPQISSCSQEDAGELIWMRSAQHKMVSPQVVSSVYPEGINNTNQLSACTMVPALDQFAAIILVVFWGLSIQSARVTFTSHSCRRHCADFSGLVIMYRQSTIRLLFPPHPNSSHEEERTSC